MCMHTSKRHGGSRSVRFLCLQPFRSRPMYRACSLSRTHMLTHWAASAVDGRHRVIHFALFFFCSFFSRAASAPCGRHWVIYFALFFALFFFGAASALHARHWVIYLLFFFQGLRAHFTLDTFCPGRKVVVVTNLKGRHSQK